jgi:membrane-associated PAP2 superfamily phosphatase
MVTANPQPTRRRATIELSIALALAGAGTLLFLLTDLDLRLQRPLYRLGAPDPWPVANRPLWHGLYYFASLPAVLVGFGALGYLLRSVLRAGTHRWRPHALFLALSLGLGPVLVVNGVFKDHWGRPRPRRVEALGGDLPFRPVWVKGDREEGKSFPCGHASIGFYLGGFYFLLRRRRPALAAASLIGAAAFGTLIGYGRMAAGAHFASDVLWAALFVWLVQWVLYYPVLRIPEREDRPPAPARSASRLALAGAVVGMALVGVVALLLGMPVNRTLALASLTPPAGAGPVSAAEVRLRRADVEIAWAAATNAAPLAFEARAQGFGPPWSHIEGRVDLLKRANAEVLRLRAEADGVFTDLEFAGTLTLGPAIREIRIRAVRGSVVIADPIGRWPAFLIRTRDAELRLPGALQVVARATTNGLHDVTWTIPPSSGASTP